MSIPGKYKSVIFGFGSIDARGGYVIPTSGGLEVYIVDQLADTVPYDLFQIEIGGYNDSQLIFNAMHRGEKVTIYAEDKHILDRIQVMTSSILLRQNIETVRKGRVSVNVRRIRNGAIIIGAIAGIIFGGWMLIRFLASLAVDSMPPQWETELGKSAATSMLKDYSVCTDFQLNRAVQEIGNRLAATVPDALFKFRYVVVQSPDINAFCLPGGYVFIFTGLIEKASSADEVAGVMAHEMTHALKRHGLHNLVQRAGLSVALFLIVGSLDSALAILAASAVELGSLKFNRDQEREADLGALDMMYKAHFNPHGFADFFRKLEEIEKVRGSLPTMLSTHPDTEERIESVEGLISERGTFEVKQMSFQWNSLTGLCNPIKISDPEKVFGDKSTENETPTDESTSTEGSSSGQPDRR
jgi:Zn-dependent protease with chaperone function